MPSFLESAITAVTASRVRPVQQSATAYGGHCTFAFSQCQAPVSTFIAGDPATSGGVCEALSAHWIRYHADGGSLWTWLYAGNAVSMAKLQYHVMQLQMRGHVAPDQDAVTAAWLADNGILPVNQNYVVQQFKRVADIVIPTSGGSVAARPSGTTGMFSANELAEAMTSETTMGAGCYKKLGLSGMGGAHAMALWVAQDVVFFDPNFGEFWFASPARFRAWFTQDFWYRSLYFAGLSGRFVLMPYAKGV